MTGVRRALIVGGSLGGLLTGCLLRRDGWQVDVFERSAEPLSGRGAGIVTHPRLLEALTCCGVSIDRGFGVNVEMRIALDAAGREVGRFSMPQMLTSWGRLHSALNAVFPSSHYHLGCSLERVDSIPGGVRARFDSGREEEGDLLLGADGIRSTVRTQYLPSVVPKYAGYIAWRGLIEECALPERTHAAIFERFAFCLPPGEQMLGYPVAGAANSTEKGQRRYNLVWYRPAAEQTELMDLLTDASGRRHEGAIPPPLIRPDHIARMREAADALLAPQFAEAVRLTPQPFFQPIYDLESPYIAFGRVALVGDAAFVARPHVGMGVTKAGADALALAEALRADTNVEQALAHYQARRLPAGAAVITRARNLGAYMQAQISTPKEREMAERYRSIDAVLRETAAPEEMWRQVVV